jgi:biofilm PGA synthesis protein PgaA
MAQTVTQRREAAVLQARAGHTEEAIGALRAMVAAGEDDGFVLMDLTALLQQAGRPVDAVAAFEKAAIAEPPDYALLAASRAYRDLKRFDDAERLARQGLRRFPDQTVWPLLLSLVLTDAGRPKESLEILSGSEAQRGPPLERRLAEGYAWRRAGDPFRALSAYTDALRLAPANEEARTAAAALLQAQGGAYGAAALAGTSAPYAADEAAAMVRWGADTRPSDPAHRFDGTDAAIARLDQLLSASPADARRLRLDRVVALRDRTRMREAVEEGAALRADAQLPPYAEEAYADALLYLRRPKEARAAYRRVLAAGPNDVGPDLRTNARYGLFYASTELEDFKTAYATIDQLVNDQPTWRTYNDAPTRYDNPDRAFAEVTAANARYYGNQVADAWARITRIADAAPANSGARLALYQIARARGWPRRAQAEGEIAASLNPDAVDSKIALAEVSIANYRFAEAQRMVRALLAEYPEDLHVRQLARDLKADLGWLFEFEAKPSDSEGGGPNAAGQALTLQAKLTSPPIADNWRLFAVTDYANAHPPEGFVDRSRASGGVAWRAPDLTATLYASGNWGTLTKPGAGATLDWSATDQILVSFEGEIYTWDTPLRALLHGITADELSSRLTYRWDESRSLSASFAYGSFTDGNQRYGAGVTYTQKLVDLPLFDLTGTGEVNVSHNDRPQAPYFNPDRDLTAAVGLLAEHTIWRRYDDSLVQALLVNGGLYAQAHFPSKPIATVSYEHRWRFDPLFEFAYGVELSRRVYDGSVENSVALVFRLARRF